MRRAAALALAERHDLPPETLIHLVCRNLPHGFFEKQLLAFFSQFGKLTHVRLSRNKKTGHAKHYAFLEFQVS